ncbi:MAG TPA: zinc ribbon domain-containing protein [Chloroflexia bacterium]
MLDTETERLLAEGKAAARNGDKNAARTLLTQVVERDPHNEQAWMWLSGVVAEPEEQQICLENVLVINPHNTKARKGLDFISVKTGMAPNVPPLAIAEMDLGNPSEYTSPLGTSPLSESTLHEETPPLPGDAPFSFSSERESTSTLPWLQADDYSDAPDVAQSPMLSQDAANGTGASWAASSQPDGAENKFDFFDMPDVDAMPPWVQPEPGGEGMAGEAQNYSGEALPAYAAKAEGISVPADDHLDGVNFDLSPFSHETPGGGGLDFPAYAGQVGMSGAGEMELPEWSMSGVLPSMPPGSEFAGANGMGDMPAPFDPFNPPGGSSMGPMGPSFDAQLPSPGDLPGYDGGGADQAQPWYLQQAVGGNSGSLSAIAMPNQGMPASESQQPSRGKKEATATIDCPNCHEKAADTALACPNCRYSFFVNCPNCHELVDTSDARQNTTEPCPYCKAKIDRMAMGLEGTDGAMPYKSESMAGVRGQFPTMKDYVTATPGKRGLSFRWMVDVLWLMVIVMTVWALTQLPTWLHLTGQY